MAKPLAQVLYVEDQSTVAAVVALELEAAHIRVTTVPNGEEALALVRELQFDLILLDQWLPGMDGLETCRRLKAEPLSQGVPVIFFTAFPSRYHGDEARQIGAADYLEKGMLGPRLAARILAEVELARDRTAHPSRQPRQTLPGPTQPPHSLN